MILIASADNDPHNRDLLPLIGGLAIPSVLPYGDVVFGGVWENGRPVRILEERKKTLDIVNCVLDGRHLRQVQDAHDAGFDFQFLIVEGIYRPGPTSGLIEVRRGKSWVPLSQIATRKGTIPDLEYKRLDDYLNEVELYLGVHVKRTSGPQETAKSIMDLYYLFQEPPELHTSLRRFYTPPDTYAGFLTKPSLVMKVAAQLTGVGWTRARAFDREFKNLADLCSAIAEQDEAGLKRVEGIGNGLAHSILNEAWLP